ncbi:uncharacterized protein LOC130138008 [Syzygium oleosum]|uniref:uncharacterized protein LOC130138008 n=1 Tax=Syzygium oleosum TaxID=219896 RepID=UPI0024BB3C5A|nr:uncharacterized protein LOC130138008 [Syzygium oleosum]
MLENEDSSSRASLRRARCSHGIPSGDFKLLTRFRKSDSRIRFSPARGERNLRVFTMARLLACSVEEARTSLAKPSIKIPAELRHTQAIEPSKEPASIGLSKLFHLVKFLSNCRPLLTSNCGSGRSLLKTRLFLAFYISQRTTETNSNSGELLLLGMYFISHSSIREVW